MFKAVGFDLGGVIVGSAMAHFMAYAQSELAVPLEKLVAALDRYQAAMEKGEISVPDFWRRVSADIDVKYDLAEDMRLWADDYVEHSPIRVELLNLVDRLRANGIKVGMFSNTNAEHVAINSKRGIFEHFDAALMSNEVKARKPEAEAFQLLASKLGLPPEQVIFVDDLKVNVEGARSAGMHGIEFAGSDELVKELGHLGLKTD